MQGYENMKQQGWTTEGNQKIDLVVGWEDNKQKKDARGEHDILATNVQCLTNQKINEVEEWLTHQTSGAFLVILSEVRRRTGRRTIAGLQATWSLREDGHAGLGVVLSKLAQSLQMSPMKIIMPGRLCKLQFRGAEQIWELLIAYAPQAKDREELERFWAMIRAEFRAARGKTALILMGDMNATPETNGRDGHPTQGDRHLRMTRMQHPEIEDLGPPGRTHFLRAKETQTILNSSRIDLVLANNLSAGGPTMKGIESYGSGHVPMIQLRQLPQGYCI